MTVREFQRLFSTVHNSQELSLKQKSSTQQFSRHPHLVPSRSLTHLMEPGRQTMSSSTRPRLMISVVTVRLW